MSWSNNSPFCAVCGRHHDPTVLCGLGMEEENLKELGLERPPKATSESFEKAKRAANRTMIKVLLFVLALIAFTIVYAGFFK